MRPREKQDKRKDVKEPKLDGLTPEETAEWEAMFEEMMDEIETKMELRQGLHG